MKHLLKDLIAFFWDLLEGLAIIGVIALGVLILFALGSIFMQLF